MEDKASGAWTVKGTLATPSLRSVSEKDDHTTQRTKLGTIASEEEREREKREKRERERVCVCVCMCVCSVPKDRVTEIQEQLAHWLRLDGQYDGAVRRRTSYSHFGPNRNA